MTVAGHTFENGRCVATSPNSQNVCDRRWVDIRNVTSADLGQMDIAHSGALTQYELDQIVAAAIEQDATIGGATLTAAGFGIGGVAPGAIDPPG